ncbi:hypothetical protein G647_04732 [Cladophialophora carrionii CBS 160.54]|uniref:ER-bound oxygenase mpaB/mpaB'/Rubber oxygenase catalytic domain-containing protein n=1 Tax=Cladophialophora carrionii CBS 160.54 TaxID=1279043 RepID=V9D9H3_9EURO|nr:uncharacterized protein G647_04732 [Cladophialophora carrionii CBS 160.54]ETI22938.1 hypothetical protein G647_04732 [Cladophialophora carrionii CBS 160.54]
MTASVPPISSLVQFAPHALPSLSPWFIAVVLLSYLALVRALRFRALRRVERQYASLVQDPYDMDYKAAHKIMHLSMLYDCPFIYAFSGQFSLLKTFTIASGTGLLVKTRQLGSSANVGRRINDTGLITTEFVVGSLDSERGSRALAKMNWMHRQYGDKITQPEMLHTLAVSILEAIRWVDTYEWRELTYLEKVALFVYWREIGNRMGIKDIPPTLEKLAEWTKEYQKTAMAYSDNNRICADMSLEFFLKHVSSPLRGVFRKVLMALLEPRTREALGYAAPSATVQTLVYRFFRLRAFVVGHLFLPRLRPLDPLAKEDRKSGRLHPGQQTIEPWYVKDTAWNKFVAFLTGGTQYLPGPKFKSEGYLPEELGPAKFEKIAKDAVLKEAEAQRAYAAEGGAAVLGCPFRF